MRSLLAVLAIVICPSLSQAQMYKCVDEQGVTHYADSALPGCKGQAVDIRPLPSISGEVKGREEDFAQQDADFKRRQNERAAVEARERTALEARCRSLRQEHAVLSGGLPLARINPQGERVYVPDEERQQRLAGLGEALRACP